MLKDNKKTTTKNIEDSNLKINKNKRHASYCI